MGLFKSILNSKKNNRTDTFLDIVKAFDDGEYWAKEEIDKLWQSNDESLILRMAEARIRLYSDEAEKGGEKAQYWLGLSLQDIGEKQESLKWLTKLAKNGNIDAMKAIAVGYGPYGGYEDDEEESMRWYLKAAESGDASAQAHVGLNYCISGEYQKAFYWYKKCANQGCHDGYLGLGKLYKKKAEEIEFNDSENLQEIREYKRMAQNMFYDARDSAITDEDYAAACHELACLFSSLIPENIVLADWAAFYYYSSYICGNNKYDLEKFKELRDKYNLDVDTTNLTEWKQRIFG